MDLRVMLYPLMKAADWMWKESENKKYIELKKFQGVADLESALTSNMGMQNLEFVLLVYVLALFFQYFFSMLHLLAMVM